MGDGLKRAFAATARTRADATLTPEMRRFLEALPVDGRPMPAARIPIHCNREQDKARQRCRRFGYAQMGGGGDTPKGWQILEAGRRALAASAPSTAERAS
jgi:hypothetical protein